MKKIFIIIAVSLMLVSCNDWLDIQPELEIREEIMYETEQGFKDVLTGVYIRMSTSSLYGFNTSMSVPELMAQHWTPTSAYNDERDLTQSIANFDFTATLSEKVLETMWV